MITNERNVLSISGGKDSTAMLLLAIERGTENMSAVFADTGNEHEHTYDYVRYLEMATGIPIQWVRADFKDRIARKREYVLTKWAEKGVPQKHIDRAAAALVPTGNPFLDLCIWKGRFPSTVAAFCSEELKRNPIINQVQNPILDSGDDVISWQGVRRDESLRRRFLSERELKSTHKNGAELWNYRPIIDWTADDCFAMHKKHGIKHNPLYEMGMGRVGCMPCINCRKDELLEISKRFPEVIDRIRQWEDVVKQASKLLGATFFASTGVSLEFAATQTIDTVVEWAQTGRGGHTFDMFRMQNDGPVCSSIYGLCE
ncbi:MAG: phosphoadenosine phosphosulfate reductase family protein [Rhodoferax sp.]|nr:phosphoadenosine phosphosulfate reductase family protein [Rhodoferax sp.]